MVEQVAKVLAGVRRYLATNNEIHVSNEPAQIYAVEDEILGVKLNSITLRAKEGTVSVNKNGIYLCPWSDDGFIVLLNVDCWKDIIDWKEVT